MELTNKQKAIIINCLIEKIINIKETKNEVLNGTLIIDFSVSEYDEQTSEIKELLLAFGLDGTTIDNLTKI